MKLALIAVCTLGTLITSWTAAIVYITCARWGTGYDLYWWGWRNWRARTPHQLDTRTPAVYLQYPILPIPVYAGQSVNPTERFRSEGKEIMALTFAWGLAIHCHQTDLDTAERHLIRWLPWCRWLRYNLTQGG